MARKQKKLTRKQRVQQQATIAHQRQAKTWISPNEKAKQRQELTEDMAPLLATIQARPETEQMEQLFWLLVDSADLAEEPEFEEIILPPLECAEMFAQVGMELGVEPEALASLPEEEREDKQMEMLETTTRRLLTDDLKQEIITALDKLRQRLKRAGRRAEASKAAALQLFLNDRKTRELWPALGLPQELVRRSLVAGIELMTSFDQEDLDQFDENEPPETLLEKLDQSSLGQKISGLLQKTPGLNKFFEQQIDKMWEEGEDAVFWGRLDLELFTLEEVEAGLRLMEGVLTPDTAAPEQPTPEITEAKSHTLFAQLNTYLTERFTPERLEQLRQRLLTVLHERNFPSEYTPFVVMLSQYMAEEEALENEKAFLLKAFLGQMRAVVAASKEAEDKSE